MFSPVLFQFTIFTLVLVSVLCPLVAGSIAALDAKFSAYEAALSAMQADQTVLQARASREPAFRTAAGVANQNKVTTSLALVGTARALVGASKATILAQYGTAAAPGLAQAQTDIAKAQSDFKKAEAELNAAYKAFLGGKFDAIKSSNAVSDDFAIMYTNMNEVVAILRALGAVDFQTPDPVIPKTPAGVHAASLFSAYAKALAGFQADLKSLNARASKRSFYKLSEAKSMIKDVAAGESLVASVAATLKGLEAVVVTQHGSTVTPALVKAGDDLVKARGQLETAASKIQEGFFGLLDSAYEPASSKDSVADDFENMIASINDMIYMLKTPFNAVTGLPLGPPTLVNAPPGAYFSVNVAILEALATEWLGKETALQALIEKIFGIMSARYVKQVGYGFKINRIEFVSPVTYPATRSDNQYQIPNSWGNARDIGQREPASIFGRADGSFATLTLDSFHYKNRPYRDTWVGMADLNVQCHSRSQLIIDASGEYYFEKMTEGDFSKQAALLGHELMHLMGSPDCKQNCNGMTMGSSERPKVLKFTQLEIDQIRAGFEVAKQCMKQ